MTDENLVEAPQFLAFPEGGGPWIPVRKVQLAGEGWYIEIRPEADGVEIRTCGVVVGCSTAVVLPRAGNVVFVTSARLREMLVHEEAVRLMEVDKANEQFWKEKHGANRAQRKKVAKKKGRKGIR